VPTIGIGSGVDYDGEIQVSMDGEVLERAVASVDELAKAG